MAVIVRKANMGSIHTDRVLVVISIIALLMAILSPVSSKVRRSARLVVCIANVRYLALVGVMYGQAESG